jgi:outer membrane protein OmpA-like peptidoglycan-associated protein
MDGLMILRFKFREPITKEAPLRFRWLSPVSALLMTIAIPWSAFADHSSPAFWICPGAGLAWPPAELGYGHPTLDVGDSELLYGGLIGLKIVPALGIEARGAMLSAEEDLNSLKLWHVEGNGTLFLMPSSRLVPLLTGGAGIMHATNDADSVQGFEKDNIFAWNVGAGVLLRFTDKVGLRVDGRYISYQIIGSYTDDGDNDIAGPGNYTGPKEYLPHPELFVGLNIGFGGKPSDSDTDGIPDKADACPDTPTGARVDARGCPIDGDSDGVPDGLDLCDKTPVGAKVDASGCPTDSDKDGVFDGVDQCANTPAGVKVNARGCPQDADGDGVPDGTDKCENTLKGCLVDATGCPLDADKDGICDGLDQCANTPADARVDSKGCPIVLTEKETELLDTGMIRLHDVNFDSNKATIKPESFPVLDEVGAILVRWPELKIEIGGHCDSQGSNAHNLQLSDERSKSVLAYLISKFPELKTAQLTTAGYGEEKPIAPNNTALGRAKNRRVEFKVLNTEVLKREKDKVKLAPK